MADYEDSIKALISGMTCPAWPVYLDGKELVKGYRPDRVYRRGSQWVIVEIESQTSRKGFIGGAIKAAMYYDRQNIGRGKFIYIVSEKNFKNLRALKAQMETPLGWLKEYGIPVPPTFLVHDTTVHKLSRDGYKFPSTRFFGRCTEV